MESRNGLLIAAGVIANFAAGAPVVYPWDTRIADAFGTAMLKTHLGSLPRDLTAMADGTDRPPEHREPPAKHLTGTLGDQDDSRRRLHLA